MADLPWGRSRSCSPTSRARRACGRSIPTRCSRCLARHDEIVRDAIGSHDGHRGEDDRRRLSRRVRHRARGARRRDRRAARRRRRVVGRVGALRVRMGLHTGEAEIARRRLLRHRGEPGRAAHGGGARRPDRRARRRPRSSSRDELRRRLELVDLGEHRLRDLARPERVFQVAHPGLDASSRRCDRSTRSPATCRRSSRRSSVATTSSSASSRCARRRADSSRSPASVASGKTRLAVQVAAEVLPRLRDGAWFCELAAADDDEAMAQVVATTLGVLAAAGHVARREHRRVPQRTRAARSCSTTASTCSTTPADFADAVVRRARACACSRRAARRSASTASSVVRVRSLAVARRVDGGATLSHERGGALFVERAARRGAELRVDADQRAAVAEICRRLDGIPLAIELAAARVGVDEPRRRSPRPRRTVPAPHRRAPRRVERHQTLRATVDWSYSLLDDDERTVFDRLGVFAGSFEPGRGVRSSAATTSTAWDVLDALASLVAKSMLVRRDRPDGTTRYEMLETLREFAREQLDESGEADVWRRRHATNIASFAEEFAVGTRGPECVLWSDRLVADLDNVRAACRGPWIAMIPPTVRSRSVHWSASARWASGTGRS